MFFWKKERAIEQSIEDYLQETERCLASFDQAFAVYFRDGLSDEFHRLVEQTHTHEHASDELRRKIEAEMYNKALIPESRGDILGMLEALDLVPNCCESILHQVWTQNLAVPEPFAPAFQQLIRSNLESYELLCRSMRDLFVKAHAVPAMAEDVSRKEAQSDLVERSLIKAIFDSQMDKADKILLKELALKIGDISDRAENAADRLRIVAVKRRS